MQIPNKIYDKNLRKYLYPPRNEYETEKEAVYNFLVEDRYEFFRQVFSFDGSCEILEPQSLRDEYIERIKKCQERYKI